MVVLVQWWQNVATSDASQRLHLNVSTGQLCVQGRTRVDCLWTWQRDESRLHRAQAHWFYLSRWINALLDRQNVWPMLSLSFKVTDSERPSGRQKWKEKKREREKGSSSRLTLIVPLFNWCGTQWHLPKCSTSFNSDLVQCSNQMVIKIYK